MNLTAYKVVIRIGKGIYCSAVERSRKNCVHYQIGKETAPNAGANQFLCVFDTLKNAQDFRTIIFGCNRPQGCLFMDGHTTRGCVGNCAILKVVAKNIMSKVKCLDGTLMTTPTKGNMFCQTVVSICTVDGRPVKPHGPLK